MKLNHIVGYVVLALVLCSPAQSQVGVVQGSVIDEQGTPVPAAAVTWLNAAKGAVEVHVGAVPTVVTDSQGRFLIPGLTVGNPYKVYAGKEEANYPDMTMGLYNPKDDAVTATAATQDKAVDVTIQVGPKAGRLSWNVTDGTTGKAVSPTLAVTRTDSGDGFNGGTPASSTYLMPPDTDIAFSVSAPGYQTWYYPGVGEQNQSTPLRLKSDETKALNIQLQRSK